jgi:hypothetical protein
MAMDKQADLIAQPEGTVTQLTGTAAQQADRIAELEHRLGADSSNSSNPPSSDAPWYKPAHKRSSRRRSGFKPGKQPGESGSSRSLIDDPNRTVPPNPTATASRWECARTGPSAHIKQGA